MTTPHQPCPSKRGNLTDRLLIINERDLKSVLNRYVSTTTGGNHTGRYTTLRHDPIARPESGAVGPYVVGECLVA